MCISTGTLYSLATSYTLYILSLSTGPASFGYFLEDNQSMNFMPPAPFFTASSIILAASGSLFQAVANTINLSGYLFFTSKAAVRFSLYFGLEGGQSVGTITIFFMPAAAMATKKYLASPPARKCSCISILGITGLPASPVFWLFPK